MVWAIIEDRRTEIRSGVGYVIFMESFVDFYLMYCDFVVCHCYTVQSVSFFAVKLFYFPYVLIERI